MLTVNSAWSGKNIPTGNSKGMFLAFLRSIPLTQNVFYLTGSEVSLNVRLFRVGFHSCLSVRLGGWPADHMELLGLQLSRPQSKFNLCLPSVSYSNCTLGSYYGLLFLRDSAGAPQGWTSHIVHSSACTDTGCFLKLHTCSCSTIASQIFFLLPAQEDCQNINSVLMSEVFVGVEITNSKCF